MGYEEGLEYFNKQDYSNAIKEFNKVIESNPNHALAYAYRARAYVGDDNEQALKDSNQAISLDPNCAMGYFVRGRIYNINNEVDKAIEDYSKAIQIDPSFKNPYRFRGYILFCKGDYEKAIMDFTDAIWIDPDYTDAYFNRGNSYMTKGDYDRAISDFDKVIQLDPNYMDAYNNRGYLYLDKYKRNHNDRFYNDAIDDFTKAIQINPNNANPYCGRGDIYFEKEEYDRAIADYNHAIQLGLNDCTIYYNRSLAYGNIHCYDKAILDCETVIRLNPDDKQAKQLLKKLQELNKADNNFKIPKQFSDEVLYNEYDEIVNEHNECLGEIDKLIEDLDWKQQGIDKIIELDPYLQGNILAQARDRNIQSLKQLIIEINNEIKYKKIRVDSCKEELEDIKSLLSLTPIERVEKQYQQLLSTKGNASTEDEYESLAEQFREINGYMDAHKLAEECDNQYQMLKLRREEQEKKDREERERREDEDRERERIKVEKRMKRNKITTFCIFTLLIILIGLIIYNSQQNSFIIPENVTTIEDKEFSRKQLVNVEIPDSVASIGNNAFRRNKLTSIVIPNSVTSIGNDAFAGNRLTSITIGSEVEIGRDAFGFGFENAYRNNGMAAGKYIRSDSKSREWEAWHDNLRFKYNQEKISIIDYNGNGGEVVIPAVISGYPVTNIERVALAPYVRNSKGKFEKVRGRTLTSVTIPNSVTTIGIEAFYDNELTSIVIPNSVTSIEWNAFGNNPITSIRIGANVKLGSNGDFGILGKGTGFNTAYANNGSRAGTYSRPNTNSTTWTRR